MSTNTETLGLFKYDSTADANSNFNVKQALNDNWDKVDTNAKDTNTKFDDINKDYVRMPGVGVATASGNSYSISTDPAPTSYVDGIGVMVRIQSNSTGSATLNWNGLGAKALKNSSGEDVSLKKNAIYFFRYSTATGNFIMVNEIPSSMPANGGNSDTVGGKGPGDFATAAQGTKADNALPASEVVTTPTANKVLRLDANKKLPADITGDANTLDSHDSTYFAKQSDLNSLAGTGRTTENIKQNADNISSLITSTAEICPYGVQYTISTGQAIRLGGIASNFNNIMPWAGMKRCVVDDNLNVLYYLDSDDSNKKADGTLSKLDGTDGQIMVEIPAHYYKVIPTGNPDILIIYVSMIPLNGFKIDPWFINSDGTIAPKRYFSAFEGSIYDASAGTYLLADEQVADFTADKLCSIAGAKPASGLTQNLIIDNCRLLANNRGSKWQQEHFNAVSCIQRLMLIEYGSLNIQSKLSQGVTNITDDGSTNMAVNTGMTVSLGNHSGQVPTVHYKTGQTTYPFSYRGIENFYGNIWKWVDGINIKNTEVYLCHQNNGFISDKFDTNYVDTGIALPNTNNWVQSFAYAEKYDFAFLPATVGTAQLFDYFWQNGNGNFVALLGGRWNDGSAAGAFGWSVHGGSSYRYRYIGARLCAK